MKNHRGETCQELRDLRHGGEMTRSRAGEIFLKSVINTLKTEKEITDPIKKADALEAFTRSMRDLAGISAEEAATLFEFMNNAAFHQ